MFTGHIQQICDKYVGKWICGSCAEALREYMAKIWRKRIEALSTYMGACVRFIKGYLIPAIDVSKKTRAEGRGFRAKFMNHRDIRGCRCEKLQLHSI